MKIVHHHMYGYRHMYLDVSLTEKCILSVPVTRFRRVLAKPTRQRAVVVKTEVF